jgi:hypothetical protein
MDSKLVNLVGLPGPTAKLHEVDTVGVNPSVCPDPSGWSWLLTHSRHGPDGLYAILFPCW